MKIHHKAKSPETIKKGRGVLVLGQNAPQKESKEESSICGAFSKLLYLNLYYKVGEVYAFTVGTCISDQKKDGTQQTRYYVTDKRGEKHTFYCDCMCFKYKQEIFLRIKEISNGQLKFESSVVERLDEIFIKGEEYEFEVISYQKDRYVVCDVQIGKNHYLSSNDSKLYKIREKLKLEVQGFDDKGRLLLVDRNPPAPTAPWINSLQVLADRMAESQKTVPPSVSQKKKLSNSSRRRESNFDLSDTPKIAPSIAIPREDKRVLVEDLGYDMPAKKEKYAPKVSEPKPVYTCSVKQEQSNESSVDILEDILKFAQNGNAEYQFLAAQYYEEHGNISAAVKWCIKAAKNGFSKAVYLLYMLGVRYESADGVGADERAAYECYKIAAEQGYAHAQYKLGVFLALGKGVYVDEERSRHYLRLAADSGHEKARKELEKMSEEESEAKDEAQQLISWTAKKAVEMLRVYAKNADAQSYYLIGQFLKRRKSTSGHCVIMNKHGV